MNDFTLLTEEEIVGRNKLSVLEKRGVKAAITDFAILLGGYVSNGYCVDGKNSLEDRTGTYFTKTGMGNGDVRAMATTGEMFDLDASGRDAGIRLVLEFPDINSIPTNGEGVKRAQDGVLELNYGYAPGKVVDSMLQKRLEMAYERNNISKTGNKYIADARGNNQKSESFLPQKIEEYEFDGKCYVRVIANSFYNGEAFTLSNGEQYKDGDVAWVEVEPIKWLVDEKAKKMVTEKLIFSGVQFTEKRNYMLRGFGSVRNFDKTNVKKFFDTYLAPAIVQERRQTQMKNFVEEDTKKQENEKQDTGRRKNPYDFSFKEVSEEEIIKGAVEGDIPVFLHGKSSDGKSSRVKQIDPDCEIIYLRNATPESLNGKSAYNAMTGEMIDVKPTWLTKLEEKCEKEKDKIHVLFFDEMTNALHSIQGMAFNIVLDKEVNGKWKLPENVRIVAAGNDISDSLAANTLAEPLFNRFAHVYIQTTTQDWLKWAATPKEHYERPDYNPEKKPEAKIHPSIYAYIAYKSVNGEDVLRTEYNGEKPNADPRKWEMASKILYATKQPEMLRSLVGEDLTRDFVAFCRQQVITIDDVINRNYTSQDLKMDLSEKFATAVGLSRVDEKNLETVRSFVSKLGGEIRGTFDNLWIHGDENRAEKIAELHLKDLAAEKRNTGMDR